MNGKSEQINSIIHEQTSSKYLNYPVKSLRSLSLTTKAVIFAIAVGTLPILTIGTVAYNLLNKSITQQITKSQQTEAVGLADTVNQFLLERYQDIQNLSYLPSFTNQQVSGNITNAAKQAFLNQIIQTKKHYDSIAIFDVQGNLVAESTGKSINNQKSQRYFQKILQTNSLVISQAEASSIYIAAPIKEILTNKTLAVVRARMPIKSIETVIKNYSKNGHTYSLLDSTGKIRLSSVTDLLNKQATAEYPGLSPILTNQKIASFTTTRQVNQKAELVNYVPSEKLQGLSQLKWQILFTTDAEVLFTAQRQLLWTIGIGTILTACVVGAIAAWLARRTTQSIITANAALAQLSQGEFPPSLQTATPDELGVLNANINQVAAHLQTLVTQKTFIIPNFDSEQPPDTLQLQLLELLTSVEGAASGDLTVRADVTAGAIGTVADFFNSIVENLRDIVTQVKQAASQLNTAIGSNEGAIRQLAEEALIQAAEINRTLEAVDKMTNSMIEVASCAQQAATVANHAAQTANKSEQAMDLTVHNILSLRDTVGETARKVKRLGVSSQEISRVVSIINQIATQTNLLAINASIEAARAGEEGQGFGVVAEEIGELAARSATATQEIEYIVENIQRETSEVVKVMEVGTTQVVEGTQIVEAAKHSLSQILAVSQQIDRLIQSISTATTSQVETSQTVSKLMQDIAAISQRTSDSSRILSQSLQQTVEISHQLQETVGTFKVS